MSEVVNINIEEACNIINSWLNGNISEAREYFSNKDLCVDYREVPLLLGVIDTEVTGFALHHGCTEDVGNRQRIVMEWLDLGVKLRLLEIAEKVDRIYKKVLG